MAGAAGLGFFLTAVEYAAGRQGLELRTFAQAIKGLYLWLILPVVILFSGNALLAARAKKAAEDKETSAIRFRMLQWSRRILLAIFCLVILGSAWTRGLFYVMSSEMVTEKVMPDGYIQGTWSEFLSESHYRYYVPVAGIFRMPFPGWTEGQLTEKVRETYNEDAELVEKQSDGIYIYRVADVLEPGNYIYFHVSNSYPATTNYYFQILCSEAAHFWAGRDRLVMVIGDGKMTLEDATDTGGEMQTADYSGWRRLSVTCYHTPDDIAACAADLTDWLAFVNGLEQLPWETEAVPYSLLTAVDIGSGEDYFHFQIFPLEDFMGDVPWEERYSQLKKQLEDAFVQHEEWHKDLMKRREEANAVAEAAKSSGETDEKAWEDANAAYFMEQYDGRYEKECFVGDGTIRYRMVVEDAAAGSRFYGLLKSTDGGATWQMSNPDPFDGQTGMGIDFTFLDEQFGFATLMHNGGDEADLYVTEDGGDSYRFAAIEGYTVTLEDGYTYTPYDYPQMPYEENGVIYMLCGQGADGDYNGGDEAGLAVYRSSDRGHTFIFVEIRKPQ